MKHETSGGRISACTHMSRRQFVRNAACMCTMLALSAVPFTALAEPSASQETLDSLSNAQAEFEAANAELMRITTELEMAQYKLSECEANLALTNTQIAETETSIQQTQSELLSAQDALAARISADYRAGTTGPLEVLLGAASFDDFVNRMFYAGKVNASDEAMIDDVKAIKASLEQQEKDLQGQKAYQEQLLADQVVYTQSIEENLAYHQSYVANLSDEVRYLMNKAQEEERAAQQAAYEAWLQAQQAEQEQQEQQQGGGGSDEGYVPDEGGGDSGYIPDVPSYSGGNHVPGAADAAACYVGYPYVWGATGPDAFDCSGLTQWCYALCGCYISRTTYTQIAEIQALGQMVYDSSQLSKGDLVFPHSGHVGIYMGGGMVVHACSEEYGVRMDVLGGPWFNFAYGGSPV